MAIEVIDIIEKKMVQLMFSLMFRVNKKSDS